MQGFVMLNQIKAAQDLHNERFKHPYYLMFVFYFLTFNSYEILTFAFGYDVNESFCKRLDFFYESLNYWQWLKVFGFTGLSMLVGPCFNRLLEFWDTLIKNRFALNRTLSKQKEGLEENLKQKDENLKQKEENVKELKEQLIHLTTKHSAKLRGRLQGDALFIENNGKSGASNIYFVNEELQHLNTNERKYIPDGGCAEYSLKGIDLSEKDAISLQYDDGVEYGNRFEVNLKN